jgi:hypothetical protein
MKYKAGGGGEFCYSQKIQNLLKLLDEFYDIGSRERRRGVNVLERKYKLIILQL